MSANVGNTSNFFNVNTNGNASNNNNAGNANGVCPGFSVFVITVRLSNFYKRKEVIEIEKENVTIVCDEQV